MTMKHDDAAKAILTGKLTAIQSYLKKQEKSQINNLTLHIKQLEEEQQQQQQKPQSQQKERNHEDKIRNK